MSRPLSPKESLKKRCEEDPKFAFDQYVSMYHACFKPATSTSSRKQYTRECTERLDRWTTAKVRAGASNGRADDVLEYGMRLATGTRAPFNQATALTLFQKVLRDLAQPEEARAIAASLSCLMFKRDIHPDPQEEEFDGASAMALADLSATYGLFSWCALDLVHIYERRGCPPEWKPERLKDLWTAYDAYRAEVSSGRIKPRICAVCGTLPSPEARLKKCLGHCENDKKPLYCSRTCQKADWPEHRRWCKPDGGDELMIDSDNED